MIVRAVLLTHIPYSLHTTQHVVGVRVADVVPAGSGPDYIGRCCRRGAKPGVRSAEHAVLPYTKEEAVHAVEKSTSPEQLIVLAFVKLKCCCPRRADVALKS